MAIADLTTWRSLSSSAFRATVEKNFSTATAGGIRTTWTQTPGAGTAPTTSVALSASSTGALLGPTGARLLSIESTLLNVNKLGTVMLVDLLNISGGLSGTSTSTQTTNLPTATLTRYTSGTGVLAALVVWTTVGTTSATATVSYTNHAGTAGRTGTCYFYNGANSSDLVVPVALQSGDTGVRSVESVTLSASTGTAGNFGVALFRPLAIVPSAVIGCRTYRAETFNTSTPVVTQNGACLHAMTVQGATQPSLMSMTLGWNQDT